jgi:site-specific recombinase XerD
MATAFLCASGLVRGGFDVCAGFSRALDDAGNEVDPVLREVVADGIVFLSNAGEPFSLDHLSDLVLVHVDAALSKDGKPGKRGACHLFRHMATLMLENGADIRFIQ